MALYIDDNDNNKTDATQATNNNMPSKSLVIVLLMTKNRPFFKMAAKNSNKSKLKTSTSTWKNIVTLVTLQSFSISGVLSVEKM